MNVWIETACSDLMDRQRGDTLDMQSGIVDRLVRCSTKELFCEECCDNQMGDDQLL